jgi:paraquat-inducible protein A
MDRIVACDTCALVQQVDEVPEGSTVQCARCGSRIFRRVSNQLARTAAFSLAALILYIPANVYPILRMERMGEFSESTIWDSCMKLFQSGMWGVAAIVFFASILVPIFKLLGLFFLGATARIPRWRTDRTLIYKLIKVMSTWAMLDVFLVAVLVALVRLGKIATVLPGPGLTAFAGVVVLTILATSSFDPRLIWDEHESTA